MTSSEETFLQAYITCALWSSTDFDGNPLDAKYSEDDISELARARMAADCNQFQTEQEPLLQAAYKLYTPSAEYSPMAQAGHDFWLTRNRHGAGFWDRGIGIIGTLLTEAAHGHGECDLHPGDDGKLYIMGAG